MSDLHIEMLHRISALARAEGSFSTARTLGHSAEFIQVLENALGEAEAFLKENPHLPASRPLLPTLAVDITYAAGEVMRFLGAESNADADIEKAFRELREAGKDEEAAAMERYRVLSAYALSRLNG